MNDELQEYLDGERSLDDLSPESREAAASWRVLERDLGSGTSAGAPAWLEEEVMREIARPGGSAWRRALTWLTRPRTLHVSPLVGGLAAAGLAGVIFFVARGGGDGATTPAAGPTAEIYVQFVFEAPGARSVAVAGDFNGWEAGQLLEDPDGDGVWTGRIPLEPGVHEYMFVVDGSEWRTDPRATRFADDGFGNRNAVLAVTPPRTE